MSDFIIRTEELSDEQIKELYVPTQNDKKILEQLKSQSPVLLVGSRGVGKSFLSKISQINLMENFEKEKIFPVFITFRSVSLIQSGNSTGLLCGRSQGKTDEKCSYGSSF